MSRSGEAYIDQLNQMEEEEQRYQESLHQKELEEQEQWFLEMSEWWSAMNLDTKYISEQEKRNDDNGNR